VPSRLLTRPGLHTSFFYVAFYMALGAHLPYWPLWLADWGLGAGEIGLYVALGMGVRVVAALAVPALADGLDARRNTIAVASAAGALLFLAHLGIDSRALLLAATVGTGAALAGIGPIGEALGLAAARVHGFAYAQARGIGSAGFLAANLAVGALLPRFGSGLVLWWIVACLVAVVLLAPGHPGGRKVEGEVPPRPREIAALLVDPVFGLFVATVAMLQASHAVMYAYGSVHWRELGLAEPTIGLLWATAVGAEIVFLLTVATGVVGRLGPMAALGACGGAGILRWSAMAADPVGAVLWPLQATHALTFAIGHLGAMAFISRAIPPRLGAAAQGALAATAGGIAMALGMVIAAAVYPTLGGATYGVGACFSALGLVLLWLLRRRWRGERLAV
jgi:MFS transporter, PPP family, 3-phenylpropionic acid transporter